MQSNKDNLSKIPEVRAQRILETYEGFNNYILSIKKKSKNQKYFKLTRAQADYIISYNDTVPKLARKWVDLDSYFGKKMMEEKLLTKIPEKIYVEKILVEKDKSFHIWGKIFENQELHDFWLPKVALIPTQRVKEVSIDYEKYSHRPPLSHQKEAIETLAAHDKYILADDMGLGKAMPNDTLIYTPNGKVEISSIDVGDEVIGSDGKSHKVIGVYPQGVRPTYKITFNDGYSILCDEEHLWRVSTSNYGNNTNNNRKDREIVLSTKQMLDEYLTIEKKGNGYNSNKNYNFKTYYKYKNGNLKWQIPTVKPIQFNNQEELPIDPYLMGLLLGDGHISNNTTVRFTLHKDDFDEMLSSYLTTENKSKKENVRIGSVVIGESLKELDLIGKKSFNKFIPKIYKTSSIENRLSIIQGLMDTDGYCQKSKNGEFKSAEFYSVSEELVDDLIEIVHSLGGIVRKRSKIPKYVYNNKKLEGKECYIANIKLPEEFTPFRLKRKVNDYHPPKKYKVGRYIKNIEYHSEQECVCISVDSPDKLYVCEHGIVTHNTTSTVIAALESGAERVLIVCPASLKINWMREIENYTDKTISIIEGKKWESADFVIINYDILKNFHDIKNKEESIILQEGFDLVVVDEAHYIQNVQAKRTKLINDIINKIGKVWLLTGTPMTSRPINYYNLLNLVESPVAYNWMAYVIRYCEGYQFNVGNRKVWNVNGSSNLLELRDRTKTHVLRRLKEDILDLPDKILTPVYLNLKSKEYESLMGEYYDWMEDDSEKKSLTVQFSKLMKVRQVIAENKIKETCEIAENIIEQGKKVIIFTNFTDTLNQIADHFGKLAVKLDGKMSKPARQHSVDQFQENDKIKVFVGNLKAAGVGITLTAAEAVIMNDLSFVPSDHSQAEDRAYRYGQKSNVSVFYPIFENSIEGIIYDILSQKKNIFETVMGDNEGKGDIMEEIINEISVRR